MATGNCFDNSTQIGPSELDLTFKDFYASWIVQASCAPPSYIRPDSAGSILPWPYTLAWFFIHFPVTLIRLHRWERVQILSIILAIITICFSLQAYASGLKPESVLVWMPIFIVLDIGAMMQLVFLTIEDSGFQPLVQAFGIIFQPLVRVFGMTFCHRRRRGGDAASIHVQELQEVNAVESGAGLLESFAPPQDVNNSSELSEIEPNRARTELVSRALIALLAVIFGLTLLVLQLYGLVAAIKGRHHDDITAVWCSTLFSGALAVQSSCTLYGIVASFSQGIGCIRLRGYEQYTWLKNATIIISISLIFQVFDCVVLSLVSGLARWRGVKMKRPWFTMFTGNLVLVIMIIIGMFLSQNLPKTVSERVTIYKYEPSLGLATACVGELTPYGVRGAIIGWTDGFLGSWGETYRPTHN